MHTHAHKYSLVSASQPHQAKYGTFSPSSRLAVIARCNPGRSFRTAALPLRRSTCRYAMRSVSIAYGPHVMQSNAEPCCIGSQAFVSVGPPQTTQIGSGEPLFVMTLFRVH